MSGNIIKRIIKYPLSKGKSFLINIRGSFYIKQQRSKKNKGFPIKVAFIVQMPEIWDKQSSVFRLMEEDDRFEPWMIIVPKYDLENGCIGNYQDEKEYFLSECHNQRFILLPKSFDIDISTYNFDYVFYQRPYNNYLPPKLKSSHLVKYTKICYIPYATPEIKKTGIYPASFFSDIYLGFMEDKAAADINEQKYHASYRRRFLCVGYPPFEYCLNMSSVASKNVLWTPRWTYDPIVGGSHFVEYWELLAKYNWGDYKLFVRPHPMMWDNFLKQSIVSETEIQHIKSVWNNNNIKEDQNAMITETFCVADILISDRSSVIPMYFLTGKPIIYCPLELDYGSLFTSILPGLYIAENWDQLKGFLDKLLKGEDPLKKERERIINSIFSNNRNASSSIVETIVSDFKSEL